MKRAFGESGVDPDRMWKLGVEGLRMRNMPRFVFAEPRRRILDSLDEYAEKTGMLYSAIADTTGCDVIVDSSKWPQYGLLLTERLPLDVYVLHLVRDPRAVAYSWQRRQSRLDGVAGRSFAEHLVTVRLGGWPGTPRPRPTGHDGPTATCSFVMRTSWRSRLGRSG